MAGRGWRTARTADRAADPRARDVVSCFARTKTTMELRLSCGHVIRRRFQCAPARVICPKCPRKGGINAR